ERLTGGAPGPEADLWALGATLFQAVEGRSPFRRDTAIETAYAIATDEVPVAGRAGALAPVIAGLLVREPERRLSSPEAERMLRAVAAETTTANVPRDALTHPQPLTGPTAVVRPPAGGVTAPVTAAAMSRYQPQAPAPAPAPTPPPVRRRRAPLWITVGVLVAALAAGGVYAGRHFGGADDAAADSPGPTSPSAPPSTPSTSAPSSPSPSYSPSPVPDGYHLAEEPDRGFSVPIPDGWTRQVSDDGQQIIYVDPTQLVGLRIGTLDFAGPSPLQHFKDEEAQTIPKLDGYEQLRMQSTQWRGRPAAIWEFTFEGKARTFRAIDLGFGDPGQREFAVYLSAPAAQWASDRRVFENAVAGLVLND
ncbi:serine/threonine protein kinase, partial [Streptomyces sp. NPDC002574]